MAARKPAVLTLGLSILSWIEWYLVHGPGDVEGQLIELDDEFASFILRCYEVNADGTRKVRRATISRPKGRAKSELAAFLACAEAFAPVRFDHFAKRGEVSPWGYEYQPGEPVGAVVKRPNISCFATELGQSGNTYDAIRYMLDPETCSAALINDYGRIDAGLTRILLPQGGSIEPETAKDSSKDGGKETFVIFDETHLWVLPALQRMHQTVIRNLLKRKAASGWAMETTTMFAPGEQSVAEGTFEYSRAVAEGRIRAQGMVFDHRQASAKWDATKHRDRLAGLAEVYGPAAAWMDLESIADSYDDPQTAPAQWERYWFNRPVSIQGAWLSQAAWDECHVARPIDDGADVVLALDGSFSGDSTALIAVEVGEFPHITVGGLWESDGSPDWRVNYGDVEDHIRTLCRRWRVVEITADPYRWARSLEVLAADGLPVTEFPQSASRMTPATQRMSDMVNTRSLTHDGDPRLARHLSNAVLKQDSRGTRLQKETKNSPRKIDLAVASVMGLERAMNQETIAPAPSVAFFA
jgi:phage terminase large subunit-like protein